MSPVQQDGPAPIWASSPRVRVETLRPGDRFIAYDGRRYTYDRADGVSSGVHHVEEDSGHRTMFAGCAEVVPFRQGGPS